jgi:hypothetical protein
MYAYQVPSSTMSGRSVAQNKRGAVGRAFMAAELVTGRVRLSRLTATQAALILKVNRTYVHAALAVGDDPTKRAAILRGYEPLVAPAAPKPVPETLGQHLARSTPTERAAAAREIGVGTVWDSMIVPSLS